MGSISQNGVRIQCYPQDHYPIHVHCNVGNGEVIIELGLDRTVRISSRKDAQRGMLKNSDVKKALEACAERYDDLLREWERMHA